MAASQQFFAQSSEEKRRILRGVLAIILVFVVNLLRRGAVR